MLYRVAKASSFADNYDDGDEDKTKLTLPNFVDLFKLLSLLSLRESHKLSIGGGAF